MNSAQSETGLKPQVALLRKEVSLPFVPFLHLNIHKVVLAPAQLAPLFGWLKNKLSSARLKMSTRVGQPVMKSS